MAASGFFWGRLMPGRKCPGHDFPIFSDHMSGRHLQTATLVSVRHVSNADRRHVIAYVTSTFFRESVMSKKFWISAVLATVAMSGSVLAYAHGAGRGYAVIYPAASYARPAPVYVAPPPAPVYVAPRVSHHRMPPVVYREPVVVYQPRPVRMLPPPPPAYVQPAYYGYSRPAVTYNRYDRAVGQTIGAVAGGVIGNQIGNGRAAPTLIGALVGGLVGDQIARD